jgi:hypothetical protein
VGENSPLFISNKQKLYTMDKENICNNIPSTSINMQDLDTVKIGSVYILTQERYEKLLKAEQTLSMIKAALCNE